MAAGIPLLTIIDSRLPSGTQRITLTGELDRTSAPTLQQWLRDAFDHHPGTPLELDLSALEFCDLAGLRTLQAVEQAATAAHCLAQIVAAATCVDVLMQCSQTPDLLGYSTS